MEAEKKQGKKKSNNNCQYLQNRQIPVYEISTKPVYTHKTQEMDESFVNNKFSKYNEAGTYNVVQTVKNAHTT